MTPEGRARGLLEAALAVVVWGASFIATKIALRDISPFPLIWLRFGIGVMVLGIAVAVRREFRLPAPRDLVAFGLLGLLGITFHQWLQSTGLITAQASTTGWIIATIPVFIAILGRLFLGERLEGGRVLGIVLAGAGVLLVVTRGDLSMLFRGNLSTPGDILILISAANWAVFSILSRRGLKRHPASLMLFFVMASGWLLVNPLLFATSTFADFGHVTMRGWMAVLFLGVFCSGFAYIWWYDALQRLPASQAGALLYVEPLVAVVVAAALLGEEVTPLTLVGGAVILAGVWLVTRRQR